MTAKSRKEALQPVDDKAIALARMLLRTAQYGALATLDPDSGDPSASRVATATDSDGTPIILISSLAQHMAALRADPRCSLLLGEPGKGDPLAHPRISVNCIASETDRESDDGQRIRRRYMSRHPKAALYADFADFSFFRLTVGSASLNGGFGKAYLLQPDQMLVSGSNIYAISSAEKSIIEHMNEDHPDAVDRIANADSSSVRKGWRLTGVDPEGCDLAHGNLVRRFLFRELITDPDDARSEFIILANSTKSHKIQP